MGHLSINFSPPSEMPVIKAAILARKRSMRVGRWYRAPTPALRVLPRSEEPRSNDLIMIILNQEEGIVLTDLFAPCIRDEPAGCIWMEPMFCKMFAARSIWIINNNARLPQRVPPQRPKVYFLSSHGFFRNSFWRTGICAPREVLRAAAAPLSPIVGRGSD